MAKISDFKVPRPVRVEFAGQTYNVTYNLGATGVQLTDWLAEHSDDKHSLLEWMQRVVLSLDLQDDNGNELPVTIEALEREAIPLSFLHVVQRRIEEDKLPSKIGGSPTPTT